MPEPQVESGPLRFCYADPPYIGQAKKHYGKVDPNAAEVDHLALIADLCAEFPDGWALSLSAPSLKVILPMCPDDVRVLSWVKPFCAFKAGVGVAYAWEPVIFRGGRRRTREQPTVRDWLAANITLRKGVSGAKPPEFWKWVFEVANLRAGDTFVDRFPGSGDGARAWAAWSTASQPSQIELASPTTKAERVASAATRSEG